MKNIISRLGSQYPDLERKIVNSNFTDAQTIVAEVILESVRSADSGVINALADAGVSLITTPPYMTGYSEDVVSSLDDSYFSYEDAGNMAKASSYFSAARLVSSCVFYHNGKSVEDLCEAAYEAVSSRE